MIKLTYLRNVFLTTVLALALAACGFHLRGNIPLPSGISNMFIEAPKGDFSDKLSRVLTNAGAELATGPGGADVVLKITSAATNRTVGTLDARGKADSYNLVFSVSYRLEDPAGKKIRSASISETRRYNFNPELVIESESEEADLLKDMEQEAAINIVRQLASITDYPAPPAQ
ncbi:MAG: LPS-assembly lipoprotein [Arenicella sp.]|jgi:LPS-assembly lipoprotein